MSLPRVPSRAGRSSGFTLIEALIALTILGVALLLGLGLLLQWPRDIRRLDAERQAMRALEATLEGMRAGTIKIEKAELRDFVTAAGTGAPRDLKISVNVSPADRPGLFQVTLTADYTVLQLQHHKRIDALFRK